MDIASSSTLLQNAVLQVGKLPGIGAKTALRQVLHLLRQDVEYTESLTQALNDLRHHVQYCATCHNISDTPTCPICSDTTRQQHVVCVVENVQDVLAIENTGQYRGRYHVLGGLISPMDGVRPDDIEIQSLVDRVAAEHLEEVILALSSTMEGDTTAFFITRRLQSAAVKITTLARGIAVGDELQYADEQTLGRAIVNRMPVGE